NSLEINTSEFAKGVYFIEVAADGKSYVSKVIKK
ncbi:MAG: T9SS type A sorting domain-containing protein, partial [Bacteroidia bacterium]|nr:T9SS type A sorting domain-containing protein [Bacteroidia bacterium]